jgi:hypothetical protein
LEIIGGGGRESRNIGLFWFKAERRRGKSNLGLVRRKVAGSKKSHDKRPSNRAEWECVYWRGEALR